ncbi:AGAP012277-PA, partial [Anopheles gambiae str. PEST]
MFHFIGRVTLFYGLLCVLSLAVAQESRLTCGRRKVKSVYLIHNGIDAKAGHWPWHAAIFHRKGEQNEYACGGAVIDENTVLTAAHCIYTTRGIIPKTLVTVHLGQLDLKEKDEYTQTHSLQEIILHPKYNSSSIINDIALLKLSSHITMTKYVQPVCLWTMDSKLDTIVGRNGTIVGFGLNEQDVVSEQLKQALIGVVDPLTCIASDRSVFGTHLTSDMFCGKGQTGVSACNGDSGGGMFFEVGGKWFVRGLVSFTPLRGNTGLCDPLKHTAYTDVAKYLEWISQYIDQRVISFENDVLDIDYEEKLRLFNFGTCGVKSSTMLNDGSSWTLPWLGFVIVSGAADNLRSARCVVTLISDWYAVGPAHCKNERVHLSPVQHASKRALFNFNTCGESSSSYPMPWMGNVLSNAPFFNVSRCSVTLISDRYVNLLLTSKYLMFLSLSAYVLLGYGLESPDAECFVKNGSTLCHHPSQQRRIKNFIIHPKFDRTNDVNNIALIELLTPADTSQVNVKPICVPVTSELRTNAKRNLHVAVLSSTGNSLKTVPIRYVESVECRRQYADSKLALNLENSFCTEIANKQDAQHCFSMTEGTPLHEIRMINGVERYFLRGFKLLGSICDSKALPTVFSNAEAYLDWILYNMKYNTLEPTNA